MTFIESETVELKSSVLADICKEVIAFANTKGGTLYIGVEDDGKPFYQKPGIHRHQKPLLFFSERSGFISVAPSGSSSGLSP